MEEKKFEDKPPVFSRRIALSKDKQWALISTTRTEIVHVNYLRAILSKIDLK